MSIKYLAEGKPSATKRALKAVWKKAYKCLKLTISMWPTWGRRFVLKNWFAQRTIDLKNFHRLSMNKCKVSFIKKKDRKLFTSKNQILLRCVRCIFSYAEVIWKYPTPAWTNDMKSIRSFSSRVIIQQPNHLFPSCPLLIPFKLIGGPTLNFSSALETDLVAGQMGPVSLDSDLDQTL